MKNAKNNTKLKLLFLITCYKENIQGESDAQTDKYQNIKFTPQYSIQTNMKGIAVGTIAAGIVSGIVCFLLPDKKKQEQPNEPPVPPANPSPDQPPVPPVNPVPDPLPDQPTDLSIKDIYTLFQNSINTYWMELKKTDKNILNGNGDIRTKMANNLLDQKIKYSKEGQRKFDNLSKTSLKMQFNDLDDISLPMGLEDCRPADLDIMKKQSNFVYITYDFDQHGVINETNLDIYINLPVKEIKRNKTISYTYEDVYIPQLIKLQQDNVNKIAIRNGSNTICYLASSVFDPSAKCFVYSDIKELIKQHNCHLIINGVKYKLQIQQNNPNIVEFPKEK